LEVKVNNSDNPIHPLQKRCSLGLNLSGCSDHHSIVA